MDIPRTIAKDKEIKVIEADLKTVEPMYPGSMLTGGGMAVALYATVPNRPVTEKKNLQGEFYFEATDQFLSAIGASKKCPSWGTFIR